MDIWKGWNGVLSAPENRAKYLDYVAGWEKKIGSLLAFSLPEGTSPDGPLGGVPFAVKDNIATAGFNLTCGSKILENFKCNYTATAVAKLEAAGARVVGKTNMDEFGMGSSTDDSALKTTNNPFGLDRVPGGSSGGSAAAVAAGLVPFALGSDTGGSIRQPASFCGVFGLKPTFGAVSRYGLVAYASSLDVVGVLSKKLEVVKVVFDTMRGLDPSDQSSIEAPRETMSKPPKTIGVLKGLSDLDPAVATAHQSAIEMMADHGFVVKEVTLPVLDYVVPAYYTIATAEASANLARYTGIRYGHRADADNIEDLIKKSRSEGFGDEVKLRILLGTYVLRSGFQDQYYIRAQKIRTAIRNGFDAIFGEVDLLMMPVFPSQAFAHGESGLTPFQQKLADKFTASANMAGIPGMAFPTGMSNGLPVGMQFLAPALAEERIFNALSVLTPDLPDISPKGYSSEPWR